MVQLQESGQKDAWREELRHHLAQTSWRDTLKSQCTQVIKNKSTTKGQVTVEEVVAELMPFARCKFCNDVMVFVDGY
jgi:hypothetical protein